MLISPIILIVVFAYVVQSGQTELNDELSYVLVPVSLVFAVGGFLAGQFIYKSHLTRLKSLSTPAEQWAAYRSAIIVRWALVEGPSIFACVSYLLTGQSQFLILASGLLVYFLTLKPSSSLIDVVGDV